MLDETQIARLAAATNALRPEWPLKTCATWIGRHLRDRAFADCAPALAAVAVDPVAKTPARLLEVGHYWKATTTAETAPRHPTIDEACATCGKREDTCRAYFGHDHAFVSIRHAARDRAADKAALARAELAQATANHCSHNVPIKFCKAHEARPDTAHTTAREQGTEQEESR